MSSGIQLRNMQVPGSAVNSTSSASLAAEQTDGGSHPATASSRVEVTESLLSRAADVAADSGNESNVPPSPSNNINTPLKKANGSSQKASKYGFFNNFFKSIGASILNFTPLALRHDAPEGKKIIIDGTLKLACIRCAVHFLPVAGAITLACLNLKGYFVGAGYQGLSGDTANAADTLALQITAKLMELLIVASIGTVVLDIIRYELTFGRDGLPFGFLGAASTFRDIRFFWSPAFWYGSKAIPTKRRRLRLFAVLISSGLLAVFAGPASALLMIPSLRHNWPGGGTDFWLVGNKSSLWPINLDSSTVGGDVCLYPTSAMLSQATLNTSGCIWYSTSVISQAVQIWHLNDEIRNLTITDGSYQRSIAYQASSNYYLDTWALSSSAAVGLLSNQLADYWEDAIFNAPIAKSVGPYNTLKYRERSSSIAKIQTPLPVVRTTCNLQTDVNFTSTTHLEFPVLPPYEYVEFWYYNISANLVNTSSILTQWIPISEGATNTSFGMPISYYPSGFLSVQIPHQESENNGTVLACSVDARWALGDNVATHVRDVSSENFIQHGEIKSTNRSSIAVGFAPLDDGTWNNISIDLDWLHTLTPLLSNAGQSPDESRSKPGWTSLASILTTAGFDNKTSLVSEWIDLRSPVEGAVAILLVEGLARIGLSENGGRGNRFSDARKVPNFPKDLDQGWNSLLKNDGKALLPPPGIDAANLTKLKWTLTISGLAYLADSTAFYLALAVIFTYIAVALGHILYSVVTRRSSVAWHSFQDMMVLSHSSQPVPTVLRNTSAGIRSHKTFENLVRIKVTKGRKRVREEEELQLMFEPVSDQEYESIVVGKAYGAIV